MKKVLVVEDELKIAENIQLAFQREGFFELNHAPNAQKAKELLQAQNFDFIILDVGLPDQSGFDLCREIRKIHQTPLLFLTARHEEIDKVLGLELGADDYLTKPFSPRELVARVKAILRRGASRMEEEVDSNKQLFTVDSEKRQIIVKGKVLELSQYEYLVLQCLIQQPGRVFSRDQLLDKISKEPSMSLDRSIDTHIKNIRSKLEQINSGLEKHIVTKRGFGYYLKE